LNNTPLGADSPLAFVCDRAGDAARLPRDIEQQRRHRFKADEAQAGHRLIPVAHARFTARVEHTEMTDE
jgi:hypothetical protein